MRNETIVAIATPLGAGGVGIIRLSGKNAFKIADKFFAPLGIASSARQDGKARNDNGFEYNKLYLGALSFGKISDKCYCVKFKTPKSFTGEDVVEFHCHGGVKLLECMLKGFIENGCRLAENGEFSKRAFINGKLKLSECEGLIDLINAESEAQIMAAGELSFGGFGGKVSVVQNGLKETLSHLEAEIEYSDEDIEKKETEHIGKALKEAEDRLGALIDSYDLGRAVKDGIRLTLYGRPNAGKSSLLNCMVAEERAIVTDIAGTTRDIIEGKYRHNGVIFTVFDTAGIREGSNEIENIGIGLSKKYAGNSDAVVFVTDEEGSGADTEILKELKAKRVFTVLTKSDLREARGECNFDGIVSSKTGEGIDSLKDLIYASLVGKVYTGGAIITNARHYDIICRAREKLKTLKKNLHTLFADMIAADLTEAWRILGEISGETEIERVIDNIFARFCVGK